MKTKFLLLLLLVFHSLFSQRTIKDSLLHQSIKESIKPYFKEVNIIKSAKFFFNQKWDSVIIYSNRYLENPSKDTFMNNFIHFFKGNSLMRKKLHKEAINEFRLISNEFHYYYIVEMYLGEIDLFNKNYKEAISKLEKLTDLNKDKYQYIKKKSILNNLGTCYMLLKKYPKAEYYFNKSFKNEKDTIELIGNYNSIANLYYEQYIDDIAINYFKKAYNLSTNLKLSSALRNSYQYELERKILNEKERAAFNMSVVEENRKDFKKALLFRKEAEQWKDSLNNRARIYELGQKEKEFAVAAKQKEVDLLQVENKLKETERKIFLYSAIGLLLFLSIGAYFFREKVKTNKIIAAQKETLDELNTTKDKLFSIVSHDLRSSVNALKSSNKILLDNLASKNLEALENLLHKNSTIVNGAYGLLDNLLNWALMQTEQQYFSIEKQRLFIITEHVAYNYKPLLLEKELNFENTVSKREFVQADQESLKIVLRNLIDNAIKFSQPNGFIKIYSSNTIEGYTNLIVEDSGLGMSDATRLKLLDDSVLLNKKEHEDIIGTGLGIQLVKSMIKKNNGKFDIESELGKGTKMIVSLPKTVLDG
ncbi:tetratricopeptide repeat-containing sensor histidine kinase [Tenacibaculum sp. 190524A05c]|uniref:tetratricopeptide repeat-containing sensor histidine kinase n=1 Tax=Tenacibaculum platacis TaxID=3137852 RepID=UPI0031FB9143